jgi:hypothetical protein
MIVELRNNDEEMLQMLQDAYGPELMRRLTVFR